ncbi:Creatinase/aminopeptidase [Boletus edulis BED1]|uniref:Creatinase/aminopeptidase n=1 Tax=Boletus edulis BED1 TaxID=1328754 RepID=A0AAD4BJ14_BOLED|nr:Creatinase/aminopeptidase [Boletus edulis BED1]
MTSTEVLNGKYPAKDHVIKTFNTLIKSLSLEDKTKPHAILLAGGTTPYRNDTDRELPFRQESNFFYLTGCSVPESYILALYDPTSPALAQNPVLSHTLKTTVYIFEPTVQDLLWSPAPPTLQEARDMYAVDEVEHLPKLVTAISQLPRGTIIHLLPETDQFPNIAASRVDGLQAALQSVPTKTSEYLLPALHKTRLIKDPYEIAMIRKANDISSRAHEVIMRVLGLAVAGRIKKQSSHTPRLPGEWLIEKEAEAEAIFVASCRREGAAHQAYLPIVAGSARASTLHYCCNDRAFAWGPVNRCDTANNGNLSHAHSHGDETEGTELLPQVLLIDAGCEWDCYSSDITRTMPVGNGGKFTEEARKVYELVLKMQFEAFKIVAPGTHWDDVHLLCHRVLVDGFLDMGIFKDPDGTIGIPNGRTGVTKAAVKSRETLANDILLTGLSAAFFPHGLGHSMGMDVHDVPSASRPAGSGKYFVDGDDRVSGLPGGHKDFYRHLRLRLELRAGMVVTIEPGIYFHPALLESYNIHTSLYINTDVLARYEGMGGVRIEDDVLITNTSCENLTKVQSGVEWVEKVCAGEDLA